MALPDSRNTTYVLGVSEVKSADLNDMQDKIIDARAWDILKHSILARDGFQPAGLDVPGRATYGSILSLSTGSAGWEIPLRLKAGQTLESVKVYGLEPDNAGEVFTLDITSISNEVGTAINSSIVGGSTNAEVTYTWDDVTNNGGGDMPFLVPANTEVMLRVTFQQTTTLGEARIYSVLVEVS